MSIKGIDTSKWQASKVDYAAAKKNGYGFAFLRIGCGSTKDKCFEADYKSAKAAGLLVGVYFYTYSTTVAAAKEDAARVIKWLAGKKLDLEIAYDVEDKAQASKARKSLNASAYNAFKVAIEAAGYKSALYTGEYFFNNYFSKELVTGPLWIAKYSSTAPNVGRNVDYWQYTSDADASDFYKGNLDRNIAYNLKETPTTKNPYKEPTSTVQYNKLTSSVVKTSVKWVQWELVESGYKIAIDGKFGPATLSAVKSFQVAHGLTKDGKVGPATRTAMKKA